MQKLIILLSLATCPLAPLISEIPAYIQSQVQTIDLQIAQFQQQKVRLTEQLTYAEKQSNTFQAQQLQSQIKQVETQIQILQKQKQDLLNVGTPNQ